MNSSTSNFEPPDNTTKIASSYVRPAATWPDELKVIVFVALVLLTVEVAIRISETKLSADLATIRQFPAVAQAVETNRANGKRTVLVLGNSLSRYGIDSEIVESDPNWIAENYVCKKAVADGTAITDWYYAFKRYFVRTGQLPDAVVIGFEGKAGGHLRDDRPVFADRLGQWFCATADVPELLREDLDGTGPRCDALLSKVSLAFANRERVRKRFLDLAIPNYKTTSQWINDVQWQIDQEKRNSTATDTPTYDRLTRFVNLTKRNDVQLIVLAMPIAEDYDTGETFERYVFDNEISFINGREAMIEAELIPDGLHMNNRAAAMFSEYLAKRLVGPNGLIKSVEPFR